MQISRIEPSHFDPGTAYVALDNHRNDDWKPYLVQDDRLRQDVDVGRGEPAGEGQRQRAARGSSTTRTCCSWAPSSALYVSLDGGKEWKKFSTGLPTVRVDDMLIHPRDRDLIVATHGRSVLDRRRHHAARAARARRRRATVKLFDPRPAVQWKNDPEETRRVTGRQFRGTESAGRHGVRFWAKSPTWATRRLKCSRATRSFARSTRQARAGMNRIQWDMQP